MDGEWEALSEDHLLGPDWNLTLCDPSLSETEFNLDTRVEEYLVDVAQHGRATVLRVGEQMAVDPQGRLAALMPEDCRTAADLAVWLDRHIPHPDIPQNQSLAFLIQVVKRLENERELSIARLSRQRLLLRGAAERKIDRHRQDARKRTHQRILFELPAGQIRVSPEIAFSFPPDQYPATRLYVRPEEFARHYYSAVGYLDGEEAVCARFIDSLDEVEYWVRNLDRKEGFCFWLQLAHYRFYPDFVVLLKDGRILVVEYKGGHIESMDETKEKRSVGEVWEALSNGSGLFRMVTNASFEEDIRKAVGIASE